MPEISEPVNEHILSKLTVDELKIAIDQLPEANRIILNLYYFEEYTHEEISTILGIKKSSSRARLSRSKKQLNSIWQNLNMYIA